MQKQYGFERELSKVKYIMTPFTIWYEWREFKATALFWKQICVSYSKKRHVLWAESWYPNWKPIWKPLLLSFPYLFLLLGVFPLHHWIAFEIVPSFYFFSGTLFFRPKLESWPKALCFWAVPTTRQYKQRNSKRINAMENFVQNSNKKALTELKTFINI